MAFCVALLAHIIYVGLIFGRLMTQFLTIMPTCALNEILLSLCDIFYHVTFNYYDSLGDGLL